MNNNDINLIRRGSGANNLSPEIQHNNLSARQMSAASGVANSALKVVNASSPRGSVGAMQVDIPNQDDS